VEPSEVGTVGLPLEEGAGGPDESVPLSGGAVDNAGGGGGGGIGQPSSPMAPRRASSKCQG
jgi:hypothetical protein